MEITLASFLLSLLSWDIDARAANA
jgi:hypothetical protein